MVPASARERRKGASAVLKDLDFVASERHLDVPPAAARELHAILRADCAFLAAEEVMDYSLLVGILPSAASPLREYSPSAAKHQWHLEGGGRCVLGIVDVLVRYSLRKQLGYLETAPDGELRQCASCVFFHSAGDEVCGRCEILNGPVNTGGLCGSWSARG